jgi:hypothetical protein
MPHPVDEHGGQDDKSGHDLLCVALDSRQVHAVLDHGDDEGSDERTEDLSLEEGFAFAGGRDIDRRDDTQEGEPSEPHGRPAHARAPATGRMLKTGDYNHHLRNPAAQTPSTRIRPSQA